MFFYTFCDLRAEGACEATESPSVTKLVFKRMSGKRKSERAA